MGDLIFKIGITITLIGVLLMALGALLEFWSDP